jgi:hypothetical protein
LNAKYLGTDDPWEFFFLKWEISGIQSEVSVEDGIFNIYLKDKLSLTLEEFALFVLFLRGLSEWEILEVMQISSKEVLLKKMSM